MTWLSFGQRREAVDVLVEPVTGSRKEMPANMAALKQQIERAKPPGRAHDEEMADQAEAAAHWDGAYAQGDATRSWFENYPDMSLRMLDSAGISAADAFIDVGGGASPLTGALLDRGFRDLTVLDVSATGMQYARERLGSRAAQVHWLTADVLSWRPRHRYQVWHDRAVFHFLTTGAQRRQYLHTLDIATAPGAIAVFGCFAPDGPRRCSGLRVARYSPAQLARQIGTQWLLISQDREEHITPAGAIQPFTWIALRRQP